MKQKLLLLFTIVLLASCEMKEFNNYSHDQDSILNQLKYEVDSLRLTQQRDSLLNVK